MNDFTKEELEDLLDSLNASLDADTSCDSTWRKDIRALKNKLQSLINNYCEHTESYKTGADVRRCCECEQII